MTPTKQVAKRPVGRPVAAPKMRINLTRAELTIITDHMANEISEWDDKESVYESERTFRRQFTALYFRLATRLTEFRADD